MKVTQWVEFPGQEVEVDISLEDIVNALTESTDSLFDVKRGLNNFYQFLKAIPDDMIREISTQARQLIHTKLTKEVQRFAVTATGTTGDVTTGMQGVNELDVQLTIPDENGGSY